MDIRFLWINNVFDLGFQGQTVELTIENFCIFNIQICEKILFTFYLNADSSLDPSQFYLLYKFIENHGIKREYFNNDGVYNLRFLKSYKL